MKILSSFNKKIVLISFLALGFLALFGLRFLEESGGGPTTTPSTQPSLAPTSEVQNLSLQINLPTNLPSAVALYELKAPPFAIFGPQGAAKIATALGFTAQAQSFFNGHLATYSEGEKTLKIDSDLGVIKYEAGPNPSPPQSISPEQARAAVLAAFSSLNLTSPFWGWEKAGVSTFDANYQETAISSEVSFLRLAPTLFIGDIELSGPEPIFADIGESLQLLRLSFWYPNLERVTGKTLVLANNEQLEKALAENDFWLSGAAAALPEKLADFNLVYALPTDYDFSQRVFLEPRFIFRNDLVILTLRAVP